MTFEPVASADHFAGRYPLYSTSLTPSHQATAIRLLESVPTVWNEHDIRFFGCIFDLFSQSFTLGASVLLASYDEFPAY